MRQEMEETILAHEMKHREKVIAVNKRVTEKVATPLKKAITQKDKEICDINDMAISMADEHNTLENQRKSQPVSGDNKVGGPSQEVGHHQIGENVYVQATVRGPSDLY